MHHHDWRAVCGRDAYWCATCQGTITGKQIIAMYPHLTPYEARVAFAEEGK